MLSAADLARLDLSALRAERRRAQDLALFEDQCRRRAQKVGIPPGFPNTSRIVESFETDAAVAADQEGLIALAIRFAKDEASGRPAPSADAAAASPIPSRAGFLARAFAALRGAPLKDTAA